MNKIGKNRPVWRQMSPSAVQIQNIGRIEQLVQATKFHKWIKLAKIDHW